MHNKIFRIRRKIRSNQKQQKTTSSKWLRLLTLVPLLGMALPAYAVLTVNENITWGIQGLDSNLVTVGPNKFPIGARYCNSAGTPVTAVVTFDWESDGFDKYSTDPNPHPYINLRSGTLGEVTILIPASSCNDAFFETEITRDALAYTNTRGYTITAVDTADAGNTATTASPREVYLEYLISQSRNSVTNMELSNDGGNTWESIAAGGTMTLMVGQTYNIRLSATTATNGYEQLSAFINFPNIIFQLLDVETTYTAPTGGGGDKLYGDACTWDDDPTSDNYLSCLGVGKVGGDITVDYEVLILSTPDNPLSNPQPLTALVYDFSGSSYHYNADYDGTTRYANIVNATIDKSFAPKSIAPSDTSTLTFAITNPGPDAIDLVNFDDNLPSGMEIFSSDITYTNCGGSESPVSLTPGDTSLQISNLTVPGLGTCTIDVTVTADLEGIYVNTSENLFIDTDDTGDNATDTLVVSSKPPPPDTCTTRTLMASWNMETSPQLEGQVLVTDVNSALAVPGPSGSGASSFVNYPDATNTVWQIRDAWTSTTGAPGFDVPYFEFEVDSRNYGGIAINLSYALETEQEWASNANNHLYIYSSVDGVNFILAGTHDGSKGKIFDLPPTTAVDINGDPTHGADKTWFRIVADTRKSGVPLANVMLDTVVIGGCPRVYPTLSKALNPDPIILFDPDNPTAPGNTSALTFTFENPGTSDMTGVGFSDTLPAGVVVADPANITGPTCISPGAISGQTITTGTDLIEMTGAVLTPGGACSFSVDVVGVLAGNHTNTSDSITSNESGPNSTPTGYGVDDLLVIAPPVITKDFGASTIFTGDTTTLSFSIFNPNRATTLTGVAFNDILPAGLIVETPNGLVEDCVGAGPGSITATAGGTSVVLSGAELDAGETCSIQLNVNGATAGLKENSVTVTSTNGGTGNTATADILVRDPAPGLAFSKKVSLDQINGPWLDSVELAGLPDQVFYQFTVENTGDVSLSNIVLTDTIYYAPPVDVSTCVFSDPLPVATAANDLHIDTCVIGAVDATQPGTVTNTAYADSDQTPPTPVDTATYHYTPTAVVIGKVELASIQSGDFLASLVADGISTEELLALLAGWDADRAASLAGADEQAILEALNQYLDPNGDGQLAMLRWDTLEQRGTIGFYVERKRSDDSWVRIQEAMMPALIAAPLGAEYQLIDPAVQAGQSYQYRLIEVEARGTTRTYGPFSVEIGQ